MSVDTALRKLFPDSQVVEFEARAIPLIVYRSVTQAIGVGEEKI